MDCKRSLKKKKKTRFFVSITPLRSNVLCFYKHKPNFNSNSLSASLEEQKSLKWLSFIIIEQVTNKVCMGFFHQKKSC